MKKFLKENWFELGIIILLLIVALSIGYYLVIFLPKKEVMKLEEQKRQAGIQLQQQENDLETKQITDQQVIAKLKQEEENSRIALNSCLDKAKTNYANAIAVINKGLTNKKNNTNHITDNCIYNYQAPKNGDIANDYAAYIHGCSEMLSFETQKAQAKSTRITLSLDVAKKDWMEAQDKCFKQYPQN